MTETQLAQQQAAINKVESLELIRCLLRVSIAHTCYLRGIFPENCFKEVAMAGLDGMVIKMLLPGKNKDASRLIDWVEHGLHDAVEKGYLDTMIFGLSRGQAQTELVEQFQYKFAYDANGISIADSFGTETAISLSSSQADVKTVKYQIVKMMRMLIQICTTLGDLPRERYVCMKLTYNDSTPADYEPPYFRADEDGSIGHFSSKPFSLDLGSVRTNHHEVSLSVRSLCDPIDEGGPDFDKAEGQGQTTHRVQMEQAMKETTLSQKVPVKDTAVPGIAIEVGLGRFKPAASSGSGIQDEPLLKDVMKFCLEGGASTIDLASAKARFADADMASLERCFDALIIKGTLQAVPNHTGTYLVSGIQAAQAAPSKSAGASKPAASASSKYKSQYADMHQDGCGAGSCRTFSTGLKQGRGKGASAVEPAASISTVADMAFPGTQDSNRQGRKRKVSCAQVEERYMTCWPTHLVNGEGDCSPAGCTSASALSHRTMPLVQAPTEEPVYQHLGDGKIGTRLRLLKMQRNA